MKQQGVEEGKDAEGGECNVHSHPRPQPPAVVRGKG